MFGTYSASAAPTLQVRAYLGGTKVADTGTPSVPATSAPFILELYITCRSIGSSGTVTAYGYFYGGQNFLFSVPVPPTTTVDTTAAQTLNVTATWGTAAAGNSVQVSNASVEILN